MAPGDRPGFGSMLVMRWIGESINTLLPVGQVGGDVARARLMAASGVRTQTAGAQVAVDFLLGIVSQAAFALMGVGALLLTAPGIAASFQAVAGTLVLVLLAGLLAALQRKGFFGGLSGIAKKVMGEETSSRLARGAAELDREVASILGDRPRMLAGFGWRLAGWLTHVGEAWILLSALGLPTNLETALALESLTWAIRSAAFLIPGAIGAQEGAIVAVGLLLGVPAESALALALAKRAREILVCGPGLLVWLFTERRGIKGLLAPERQN
ncbi:putative integral membrane protein [Paramagnetospirillum magnetotacticum MS-1]|uniref:Putative integral membrane protein n=2 Tax=Paramagnetospirillum magnetotacticum TaxID=188 RepID=A0A0C2YQS2_PARME|nr:putative integral membrane protein [Paramagnetospirillum magnetotacticum MS-1]